MNRLRKKKNVSKVISMEKGKGSNTNLTLFKKIKIAEYFPCLYVIVWSLYAVLNFVDV